MRFCQWYLNLEDTASLWLVQVSRIAEIRKRLLNQLVLLVQVVKKGKSLNEKVKRNESSLVVIDTLNVIMYLGINRLQGHVRNVQIHLVEKKV